MLQAYVHAARVQLAPESDEAAPGGAVTVALCGHWQHDGPCRWPHHTAVERVEGALEVRTVVVSDAADEPGVRERIDDALESGEQDGPDGRTSTWILLTSGPDDLRPHEEELAHRLRLTSG
jgi:hypothetical protein